MGTDVAKTNPFGNVSLRNSEAMAETLAASASKGALGVAPDGCEYLNFSGKTGTYGFGREKEDVDPSELWLVNVAAFQDGFICWKGGNAISKRLYYIFSEPAVETPATDELGPFDKEGEGWFAAKAMIIRSLDDPDRQAYFAINSRSGVAAMADLQAQVADKLRAGEPCWPIVQLGKEKFEAKGYKNFKPVFEVYGWLSDDALQELADNPNADVEALLDMAGGVEPEPEPEPEPARRPARRRV